MPDLIPVIIDRDPPGGGIEVSGGEGDAFCAFLFKDVRFRTDDELTLLFNRMRAFKLRVKHEDTNTPAAFLHNERFGCRRA